MKYLGDLAEDQTVRFSFNTRKADGTAITLGGTPVVSVYKDGSTTELTTGVTLTVDFDSRVGHHVVTIDTAASATYTPGSDYRAVITTGTVDSVSVVGTCVAEFSIESRRNTVDVTKWLGTAVSAATAGVPNVNAARWNNIVTIDLPLAPTVAGRTLDVSAGGEAGIDWANIGGKTTANALTSTTFATSQVVASVSGAVGSVSAGVTVATNNDKTGYALSAAGVDAIWDEAVAGHTTPGTYGASIIMVGVLYTHTNNTTAATEDVTITR